MINYINKFFFIYILFLVCFSFSCSKKEDSFNKNRITIIKYEHSKLVNSIEEGLIDELYYLNIDDIDIVSYTGNGTEEDAIRILTIAKHNNSKVIVTISREATLLALNILETNKILFAGYFSVEEANQIYRHNNLYGNVKGIYKVGDANLYVEKLTKLLDMNSIGYMYRVDSIGSLARVPLVKNMASNLNITYYDFPILRASSITNTSTFTNYKNIDVLYVDDSVLANINLVASNYSIPIVTSDNNDFFYDNILLSMDVNYYKVGRLLSDSVLKIINGESIENVNNILLKSEDYFDIYINEDIVKKLNIKINTNSLHKNTRIIKVRNIFQ